MSNHSYFPLLTVMALTAAPVGVQAAEPDYLCQVMASERIDLASQVPGVIDKIMVERGDKVVAGQVVARLRADVERVAFELAQARAANETALLARQAKLDFATRKYERNITLAASNVVSANELDSMRTDRDIANQEYAAAVAAFKEAQIELRKAQVELDLRTIRSPMPGVVTERKLTSGDLVRDQPLVVIQRIDPLFVELSLPVSTMGTIAKGSPVRVTFSTPGVAPVDTTITLIDSVIDAPSDTFGARIVLQNPDGAVPAGTKCHVTFDLPTR